MRYDRNSLTFASWHLSLCCWRLMHVSGVYGFLTRILDFLCKLLGEPNPNR